MYSTYEFGECLKRLLSTLNSSGSRLAKMLNVDPSLVSKWVNSKKVPSYGSPYIEAIAEYMEKSILNSFQEQKVHETIDSIVGMERFRNKDIKIKDKIKFALLQTQGYSIESKISRKPLIKDVADKSRVSQITPSCDSSLITGYKAVLRAALSLLEEAAEMSPSLEEPILITYNTDIGLLPFCPDFPSNLKKMIIKVLSNGWRVSILIRFNNNLERTIRFVDDMQQYLMIGKCTIYYTSKFDPFMSGREVMAIPHIGALVALSTKLNNQPDSAFLFRNTAAINIFMKNFGQMISFASPLIEKYSIYESIEYRRIITEFDEIRGNRYLWKDGVSSLSISLELYEKYLKKSRRSSGEIVKLMGYHRRRLESFNELLKYYNYKNILTKQSIENMVKYGEYSFNELYLVGKYKATPLDVLENLKNMVYLLKKHDNYEIAFVDKTMFKLESNLQWIIKEQKEVLFHMENKSEAIALGNDSQNIFSYAIVREPMIIKAFEEKFLDIWNYIVPQDKDKREVIIWIERQIEILSRMHNIQMDTIT